MPGIIKEIDASLPAFTEQFKPISEEAQPGVRLLDHYADQVNFNLPKPDKKKLLAKNTGACMHSKDSLSICCHLTDWFAGRADQEITFVQVPSHARWGVYKAAHDWMHGLPSVLARRPETLLDKIHHDVTRLCQDAWISRFQDKKYYGHQFSMLKDLKGRPLQPKYANGRSWLPSTDECQHQSRLICLDQLCK